MKKKIRKLIPKSLMPFVLRIYWRVFYGFAARGISKREIAALDALKCQISYNKYGGYCVPSSSKYRPAALKVLSNDVFEPETIEFIRANCRNGDVVHAGAFFGDFLPALGKALSPDAKVWAFEPNSESYRCAAITIQLNNLNNVNLNNAGLGAERDEMLVKVKSASGRSLGGASKIVEKQAAQQPGTETVAIVAIDDEVGPERDVSVIHLDVEGFEKQALIGALKTIRRCRPIILIEVLPSSRLEQSDWFAENILSLKYQKADNINDNSIYICQQN